MKENGENVDVDKKNVNESTSGKKQVKLIIGIVIAIFGFLAILAIVISILIFSIFSNANKEINNKSELIFNKVFEIFDMIDEEKDEFDKSGEEIENDELEEGIESDYTESESEVKIFNSSFEFYVGSRSGFSVKSLLDKVNTNNKTKVEHIITVVYNGITTSDTTEITNMKQTLENNKKYEVSLDYDTNGFVNKVTIVII